MWRAEPSGDRSVVPGVQKPLVGIVHVLQILQALEALLDVRYGRVAISRARLEPKSQCDVPTVWTDGDLGVIAKLLE